MSTPSDRHLAFVIRARSDRRKLLSDSCRSEMFDFDEPIILNASDLGKGKHKISAEVFASWNTHTYIEKNEAKIHSEEIEIEIN